MGAKAPTCSNIFTLVLVSLVQLLEYRHPGFSFFGFSCSNVGTLVLVSLFSDILVLEFSNGRKWGAKAPHLLDFRLPVGG